VNAPAAVDAVAQELDRRRVYILPTRAGYAFGGMLAFILLGAINYDNALAYLLAFLLGGLTLVAMLHTYRNLGGLRFVGARAWPVFAGETASFACHFENHSRLPRLALHLGPWPEGMTAEERRFMMRAWRGFDLTPAARDVVTVSLLAPRRGWQALGRLRVETRYPLGIFRAWAYFACKARVLVYPVPRGRLPLPEAVSSGRGSTQQQLGGVDEFAGLRPYVAGDPVRAIAWKSLAQERELVIKKFQGQGRQRVRLTWAATARLATTEERLSQLCRWVLDAERGAASFNLELPDERLEFARGPAHLERCLRALALYERRP
jgi:uncharacterized protein (DUF58 family)